MINLKPLREKKGLTRNQLCEKMKQQGYYINRSTYSKYETGANEIFHFRRKYQKFHKEFISWNEFLTNYSSLHHSLCHILSVSAAAIQFIFS